MCLFLSNILLIIVRAAQWLKHSPPTNVARIQMSIGVNLIPRVLSYPPYAP